MARLSRLLSAVSLGIAATVAVAAATIATEYAPVRKAPTQRAESASSGRVIVKFKDSATGRSTIASATTPPAGAGGPQKASLLGSRLGLALTDGRILGERTQVLKASGMTSSALASALAADPEVEWAEVDHKRYVQAGVDDPRYADNVSTSVAPTGPASGQWYLRAPGFDASGRNVVSSINIEPAWAITHGSPSIVVADVDTGITPHPDLDSKMLAGYDFIADIPTANDGSARDGDPTDPGDYITAAENSQKTGSVEGPFFGCNDNGTGAAVAESSSWHGTQTASVLGAATNNAIGMAGTGYDTPVVAARALGKCGGFDSDIIAAAQWGGGIAVSGVPANAHPARVVNMSLGANGTCTQAYTDALTALRNKGVVVVAAAGNGDAHDKGIGVTTPANCKPAASDPDQTPIVIAVAALRHAGTKVGFSNLGPEVTVSAPGGNCINTAAGTPCLYPILTALNAGTTTPVSNGGTYSDSLNSVSLGTSFATPMVAGTVALMLSANPNLTNLEVARVLQHTANAFPALSDTSPQPPVCTAPNANAGQAECICTTSTCGAGMLNAGAAVATAQALLTATAPSAAITSSAASVQVGQTAALSGTTSALSSTGAALSYQWAVASGSSVISLGNTAGSSVSVTGVTAGAAQVRLTVTDSNGMTSVSTASVTVTAAPSSGGGGGGGGGAANPAWLLALALAGLLLGPRAARSGR